jgi:hypothetical protein
LITNYFPPFCKFYFRFLNWTPLYVTYAISYFLNEPSKFTFPESFQRRFFYFIPPITLSPLEDLLLTLTCALLALLKAPPNIDAHAFSDDHSYWPTVEKQIVAPLEPTTAHPESHAAKKVFRLTVPLIAKILNLNRHSIFILQTATFFFMLYVALTLAERITDDRIASFFFVAGLVPLYLILSAYQEATGHLDAFAYCFLLASLYFRNPFVLFVTCTCASWCDERAFLATMLVFVWWSITPPFTRHKASPAERTWDFNPQMQAVACSIVGYVSLRILLTLFSPLSLSLGSSDLMLIRNYYHLFPLIFLATFSGMWILLLAAVVTSFQNKRYTEALFIVLPLFLFTVVASMVWDFTRSLTFAFPTLFISLFVLHRTLEVSSLRQLTFAAFMTVLLAPIVFFDSQLGWVSNVLTLVLQNF